MNKKEGQANIKKTPISTHSLKELLRESVASSPAVSIRATDMVSEVACLLPHHLETFTDSLVVTQDEKPVGIVGGEEILSGIFRDPSVNFFDNTRTGDIMTKKKLSIVYPNTILSELLNKWSETKRAFSLLPNQYHGYSVISARKILEIGSLCKSEITVSSIPIKKFITFEREDTVRNIISTMFSNMTRKLILKGTTHFVSDRIIIQKVVRELDFLRETPNFLDMRADIFSLDEAKTIPDDMKVSEASRIMHQMKSPYLIINDMVITPWDIAMILRSENLTEYEWHTNEID